MELTDEYLTLLGRAIVATLEAGRCIMDVYRSDDFDVRLKADDSPLTRADRLAHDAIRQLLAGVQGPSIPLLSEEGADVPFEVRRQWPRFWLVDPLDGTREFIKRNGEFTVNIAMIEQGRSVLGVVYAPEMDRLYFGMENVGAFRLDKAWGLLGGSDPGISIDKLIGHANSLPSKNAIDPGSAPLRIVASRSHMNEETRDLIGELEAQYGRIELVQAGSSMKLCLVAEGSADLYPRLGPTMEWDTAAAHAVVSSAGGRVVRLPERCDLSYNKPSLLNPHFLVVGRGFPSRAILPE